MLTFSIAGNCESWGIQNQFMNLRMVWVENSINVSYYHFTKIIINGNYYINNVDIQMTWERTVFLRKKRKMKETILKNNVALKLMPLYLQYFYFIRSNSTN